MGIIRVRAHAKINLSLRVLGGPGDDGYHELRTVFQALALHDMLTFVPRPGPFAIEPEAHDPGFPLHEGNLVWRAADLLWRRLGRTGGASGVAVRITKRIPMKGGLGGGSSDAAAALVGLARLWDADVPPETLRALGQQLGADVGFFFTGGAALGLGRGDRLHLLPDLPRLGVLLVVPRFDVSTADAYRWIDESRVQVRDDCDKPAGYVPGAALQAIPGCTWPPPACEIVNEFESVVSPRHPEVDAIKDALGRAGAAASAMTGSGSTIFGLFEDESALPAAATRLADFGQTVMTHTLGRAEFLEASTPTELQAPER